MGIYLTNDRSKVEMRLYNTNRQKLPGNVMQATIQRGATSTNGISVGSSIATQIQIQCEYSTWMQDGKEFYFEIYLPSHGVTMYLMKFIIFDQPIVSDKIATITAYSNIYKLQRYMFNTNKIKEIWEYERRRATFGDVLSIICETIGVECDFRVPDFNVMGYDTPEYYPIPNYIVEFASTMKYNCRQMLEFVAGAYGANCFDIYDEGEELSGGEKWKGCKICVNQLTNYMTYPIEVQRGDIYRDGIRTNKSTAQEIDRLVIQTFDSNNSEVPEYMQNKKFEIGKTKETSKCELTMTNPLIDWTMAINLLGMTGASNQSNGTSVGTGIVYGVLSKVSCSSLECSLAGNVWVDETRSYTFPHPVDGTGKKYIPMEVVTVVDGGIKTTFKSSGQKESDVSSSGGGQAEKMIVQNIMQSIDFIRNMEIEGARIKDSTITSAKIANSAIKNTHIEDSSITNAKIADSAITGGKIADATITSAKIANSAIKNTHIADSTITSAKIANSAIKNTHIADSTITNAKIADSAITGGKIADSTITGAKIKDGTITGTEINFSSFADGVIKGSVIESSTLKDIPFASMNNVFIQELTGHSAYINQLKSDIAEFGYITAEVSDSRYANIKLANIETEYVGQLFAKVGLIDRATIVNGHVTGFLDSVEVNANSITAGTIIAERLLLKGSKDGLLYAINNLGELTSSEMNTLDGDILTDRTITKDKIVAKSITANEIDVESIFAQNITASGTIKGLTLEGTEAYIEKGKIGIFEIGNESIFAGYGTMLTKDKLQVGDSQITDSGFAIIGTGTGSIRLERLQKGEFELSTDSGSKLNINTDNLTIGNLTKDTTVKINGTIVGETKFASGTYTDPWSGNECAIKASGDVGIGNNIRVGKVAYIGDFVQLWSDNEGGNIRITAPSKYDTYWEQDAFNGDYRIYRYSESKGGVIMPFNIGADSGRIQTFNIFPYNNNQFHLGTTDKQWASVQAIKFCESGIDLEAKYELKRNWKIIAQKAYRAKYAIRDYINTNTKVSVFHILCFAKTNGYYSMYELMLTRESCLDIFEMGLWTTMVSGYAAGSYTGRAEVILASDGSIRLDQFVVGNTNYTDSYMAIYADA